MPSPDAAIGESSNQAFNGLFGSPALTPSTNPRDLAEVVAELRRLLSSLDQFKPLAPYPLACAQSQIQVAIAHLEEAQLRVAILPSAALDGVRWSESVVSISTVCA